MASNGASIGTVESVILLIYKQLHSTDTKRAVLMLTIANSFLNNSVISICFILFISVYSFHMGPYSDTKMKEAIPKDLCPLNLLSFFSLPELQSHNQEISTQL